MQQLKQMGSMKKMLGMLPGMGQMREQLDNFDEREIDRIEAIVRSMTPAERARPKIINGSRRARIAKGSGTTATDVNQLLERFERGAEDDGADEQGRRHAGDAGMPACPGIGGGKKARGKTPPPARARRASPATRPSAPSRSGSPRSARGGDRRPGRARARPSALGPQDAGGRPRTTSSCPPGSRSSSVGDGRRGRMHVPDAGPGSLA